MLSQMIEFAPDLFFESSAFPIAFRVALAALTLIQSDLIFASLDLFRVILTHDCLSPTRHPPPPPKFPGYANAIRQVIDKEGFELVGLLLSGLAGDFPEDSSSSIITLFRVLSTLWSSQMMSWIPTIFQRIPSNSVPDQAKSQFLNDYSAFVFLAFTT